MESINFIPDQQKKNQLSSKASKKLSYPNLLSSFILLVIAFGVGLWSLDMFLIQEQIANLEQTSRDLDGTYGELYPAGNLPTTIGSVSELASDSYPVDEVLPQIQSVFFDQLTLNSLSYSKQSKVIRIQVELDSLDSIVAQVDALEELDRVTAAEYSNISATGEGGEQSAEISLTLR